MPFLCHHKSLLWIFLYNISSFLAKKWLSFGRLCDICFNLFIYFFYLSKSYRTYLLLRVLIKAKLWLFLSSSLIIPNLRKICFYFYWWFPYSIISFFLFKTPFLSRTSIKFPIISQFLGRWLLYIDANDRLSFSYLPVLIICLKLMFAD